MKVMIKLFCPNILVDDGILTAGLSRARVPGSPEARLRPLSNADHLPHPSTCLKGESDANIDPPIHGACFLCALYPGSWLVGWGMTLAIIVDTPEGDALSRSCFNLSTNPGIIVVPPATTTDPSRSGLISLKPEGDGTGSDALYGQHSVDEALIECLFTPGKNLNARVVLHIFRLCPFRTLSHMETLCITMLANPPSVACAAKSLPPASGLNIN